MERRGGDFGGFYLQNIPETSSDKLTLSNCGPKKRPFWVSQMSIYKCLLVSKLPKVVEKPD